MIIIFKKWGINSILLDNFITYEYNNVIQSDLSTKTILMIGRSHDKLKRLELGLFSMEYIIEENKEYKMTIISNITNKSNNLIYLVNNLNLENYIKFEGYSSTPEIFYKNSSLHFFPTKSESFGLVLSETKIYGIPNILVGLDYVSISKGGTFIVYDNKPEYIAKESLKILKDEKYKKEMSNEARKSMLKFQNKMLLIKWIKLIISLYNGYNYYINFKNKIKSLYEKESLKILNKQLEILKLENKQFKNITLKKFLNFSFLEQIEGKLKYKKY